MPLSFTSKMDGVPSWSLPAYETCPGAIDEFNDVAEVCQRCYAMQGHYPMGNARKLREANVAEWQQEEWVSYMVQLIRPYRYFRWFDSGDIYDVKLAKKIYEIMQRTPQTRHWLPTRSHKVFYIKPWLEKMKDLRNVCVRYSSDSTHGVYDAALHGSVVISEQDELGAAFLCGAPDRGGKCGSCKACWSKKVSTVAYRLHGYQIKKFPIKVVSMEAA